ncbi:hypothetical protein JOF56_000408 [Kibdelosporangium banguiense]|uniref:Uncharacterized protein n=1 Tax=Kibdelosporangium banguiense TaxID=1365924 RepID=A0ABS4T6K4_9PSEU|nr:hypothetical protein [Kibdelosporangium banguiense]MBP2320023.1 hypothetical protein [Kibdelosporangium banguiense]
MPEPVLVAISAALAGKAVTSFYDFVRNKISGRRQAVAALEAADGKAKESPEVQALAGELATIVAEDPEFGTELRERWASVQNVDHSTNTTINSVSGTASGPVIQTQTITGGINIGR